MGLALLSAVLRVPHPTCRVRGTPPPQTAFLTLAAPEILNILSKHSSWTLPPASVTPSAHRDGSSHVFPPWTQKKTKHSFES